MSLVVERPQRTVARVSVESVLHYTQKTGVRPVAYTYELSAGVPKYSGEVDARTVSLQNARLYDGLGLDTSGFEQIRHRSAFIDWSEYQEARLVEAIYYPEVVAAVLAPHRRAQGHRVRPHAARQRRDLFERVVARAGATRARRPDLRVGAASAGKAPLARGGRGAAASALRDRQLLAADRRPGAAGAARDVRCAQHRGRRPDPERPRLPRLDRRDLLVSPTTRAIAGTGTRARRPTRSRC